MDSKILIIFPSTWKISRLIQLYSFTLPIANRLHFLMSALRNAVLNPYLKLMEFTKRCGCELFVRTKWLCPSLYLFPSGTTHAKMTSPEICGAIEIPGVTVD